MGMIAALLFLAVGVAGLIDPKRGAVNPLLLAKFKDAEDPNKARSDYICKQVLLKKHKLSNAEVDVLEKGGNLCKAHIDATCAAWAAEDEWTTKIVRKALVARCTTWYTKLMGAEMPDAFYVNALLGGFHKAKKNYYQGEDSDPSLSVFPWEGGQADTPASWPLMRSIVNEEGSWAPTELRVEGRRKLMRKIVLSMIGDERIAFMLELIEQCGASEAAKAGVAVATVAVRPQSSGSTDVTSDFDVTLMSADFKDTPAVAHCFNSRFMTEIAPVINKIVGEGPAMLTTATFYDGNAYAEDFLPTTVDRTEAGREAAIEILKTISTSMLAPEVGNGAQAGARMTLDQLIWAFRHVAADVEAIDQTIVPYGPAELQPVDPSKHTAFVEPYELEWLPFGVASGLETAKVSTRAASFRALLSSIYKTALKCGDTSHKAEHAAAEHVRKDLAAKDYIIGGAQLTLAEATQVARNILYVQTASNADKLKAVMEAALVEHGKGQMTDAKLSEAVLAYHNARSLSLVYSPEGGKTMGNLWHVLAVIQMGNYKLELPTELLLVSFVENYENVLHSIVEGKKTMASKAWEWFATSFSKYYLRWADAALRLDGFNGGAHVLGDVIKKSKEEISPKRFRARMQHSLSANQEDEDTYGRDSLRFVMDKGLLQSMWKDAELPQPITPGRTLPSSDEELRYFMCYDFASRAANGACTADNTAESVLNAYTTIETEYAEKLKRNSDVLAGILGNFAKHGVAFDKARRAAASTGNDLVREHFPDLGKWKRKQAQDNMRSSTQSVVAGALSQLLQKWNCWTDAGTIKPECLPSIPADTCNLPAEVIMPGKTAWNILVDALEVRLNEHILPKAP